MNASVPPPSHVLARQDRLELDLEQMKGDLAKQAARFWLGTAANKLRKDECERALKELFRDRKRLAEGIASLREDERQVVAILQRYGGSLSGMVLRSELTARNLVEKNLPKEWTYLHGVRRDDAVLRLTRKCILLTSDDTFHRHGYTISSYSHRQYYPDVSLHPALLGLVEPAAPLRRSFKGPKEPPQTSYRRSAGEVAFDLAAAAETLRQAGDWKMTKANTPEQKTLNRLHKCLNVDATDDLVPPDIELLYYEFLQQWTAVRGDWQYAGLASGVVERFLNLSGPAQAARWAQGWLAARSWQDGVGKLSMSHGAGAQTWRELLAWALARVAHADNDWIDAHSFLADLWSAAEGQSDASHWYGHRFSPNAQVKRPPPDLGAEDGHRWTMWVAHEGTWALNAILGTLVFLALVERGQDGKGAWYFRLTGLGRQVFGAPDLPVVEPQADAKFLTVQPNHEIVANLIDADAGAVWPLARIGKRISGAAGPVQTFSLTRESIYAAQESGWSTAMIRQYLSDHSKTGLPVNVEHSLEDWGRRREALVIRSDVLLAAFPTAAGVPELPGARRLGDRFLLLGARPGKGIPGARARNLWLAAHRSWRVDSRLVIHPGDTDDAVMLARLRQFAEPVDDGWQLSARSIQQAGRRGILLHQVRQWLTDHLVNGIPELVGTALRNWTEGSPPVNLGDRLLLHVSEPEAWAMMRKEPRFKPFLVHDLPPDYFIVRSDRRSELNQLLTELGFSVGELREPGNQPTATEPPSVPEKTASGRATRRKRRE